MINDGDGYKPPTLDGAHQRALRIIKGTAEFSDRFIPDHKDLVMLIDALRAMGCTIVFVAGVWDMFHIGHAEYIRRGKEEAGKLYPKSDHVVTVIGVETDELTKIRKGPDRPVIPQDERVKVLAHLRSVDILTLQYRESELYKIVKHDVRVISQSTTDLPDLEEIQRYCANIVNLPPQAETSTTGLVRKLTLEGGAKVFSRIEKGLTTLLQEVRNEIKK